jgi:hypothetical protein
VDVLAPVWTAADTLRPTTRCAAHVKPVLEKRVRKKVSCGGAKMC